MSYKFGSGLAEALHALSLEGSWQDGEAGTVDDIGWHGLFVFDDGVSDYAGATGVPECDDWAGAILREDSQGFVDVDTYDTAAELEAAWADVQSAARGQWEHDPSRDGAGCGWCGAWAQVNSDGLCEDCWSE